MNGVELNEPLSPPKQVSRAWQWVKRVAVGIVFAVLLFLLYIFTVLAADRLILKSSVSQVFGFAPLTVLTGSMEPEIYPGDMVIIHRQAEYNVGDVVTYLTADGTIGTGSGNVTVTSGTVSVTHKIVDKYVDGGVTYFITRGINNNTDDPNPVAQSQVVGKVVLVLEGWGIFFEWLKTPSGIIFIILFACIIIAAVYVIKE